MDAFAGVRGAGANAVVGDEIILWNDNQFVVQIFCVAGEKLTARHVVGISSAFRKGEELLFQIPRDVSLDMRHGVWVLGIG